MLKKVHILNPSDKSCKEKKHIQCTVCKTKAKSILYVCESGHVICKSCQNVDTTLEDSNEGGDYIPEKECGSINNKKEKDLQTKNSETQQQDLASGDHDGALILTQRTDSEIKRQSKVDDSSETNKEHCSQVNFETTIEYKNENYQESKTSAGSNIASVKDTSSKEEMQDCKIVPRPVMCPVTNCSKMVTIDSIMLHFHFDHSKVPRIILDGITPQEICLKSANFSTEIQCLATFMIQNQNSPNKIVKTRLESITSLRNSFKDNRLLLLMAVRLPTSPIKLPILKCDASRVFTRSIHTQTEKIHGNDSGICTECLSKSSSDYKSCISKFVYDEDEVLLLWLCKLDHEEKVYSITLLREDKKRGYCYIGDAVHIRDKQDPSSLYDKSECLTVKGSAVSSLYDLENQITAIVSIIK